MKRALNQNGKMTDIIESIESHNYTCPICKEKLTRNFGTINQFFSHPKGKGDNCEYKLTIMEKFEKKEFTSQDTTTLQENFYNNKFDNVHIDYSDYKSEDGYFLTKEQKEIIFSKEDRIKIAALAGSAKSSTLYYYAKERPFKKILYMVYNKSARTEAELTFGKLSHVDIKTMHGLAYGYVGKLYKDKLTFNYGVIDVIKDLSLDWNRDMELAVKIHAMLNAYMVSDKERITDLELYKDDTENRPRIVSLSEKLWEMKKKYNNNIKVEHDFYLKLFQLSKKDLSNKYDIILLDESQDSSLLILDMLNSSNVKGITIVGDQYQALYSWRAATNIMPLFEAKEYKLTTSFRVGQNIASIANIIIMDMCKNDIQMKGFNTHQHIVDKIDRNKKYACLCRTNSYIFAEVMDLVQTHKKKKIYFEGGYSSYKFENIKDAYYFSQGYETKNSLLKKFKDYREMEQYTEQVEDLELLALIRIVDKYGEDIPDIVDSVKYNSVTNKEDADVLFTTIHKSKGSTINIPMYISEDHFDIRDVFDKEYIQTPEQVNRNKAKGEKLFDLKDYYEEMAILYVAITRCAGEIELSDKLKQYLLLRFKIFGNLAEDNNSVKELL